MFIYVPCKSINNRLTSQSTDCLLGHLTMLFKSVDIKFRNKYKLLIGEDGEAVTTSDGVAGVNLPAESNQRMINDNTERVCV